MSDRDIFEDLRDQIVELKVSQAGTYSAVSSLTERITSFVEMEEGRFNDLNDSRLRQAELMSGMCATLREMKEKVDSSSQKCPNKEVVETVATVKTQTWLMKAIVGVTIIAAIGGLFGTVNSCYMSSEQETQRIHTHVDKLGSREHDKAETRSVQGRQLQEKVNEELPAKTL